ncbi:MAG: lysophospholipid acyltransferase family protein [Oscillospiraceae bacterium]|jgi:1-acyl-sn-glycerol-3-phosphate acyltransferase
MNLIYNIAWCIAWPFFNLLFPTKCVGLENIPEGSALLCANHTSYLDPVMLAIAIRLKNAPCFMAKAELMRVPVLGWLIKKFGAFGVKRGMSDLAAIKHADELLRAGRKVALFPQGTRVKKGRDIRAKSGAVRLAVSSGAPLIPVFIPEKKRLFRINTVIVGKPYYMEPDLTNFAELRSLADELLNKIFDLGEERNMYLLNPRKERSQ